jgi:ketosteroid isomerase-like protein
MELPLRASLIVLLAATAGAAPTGDTSFDSLVAAERAFARAAAERSIRSAFVEHLEDGAVLFQPGPVDGRAAHRARAETPARLSWAPAFAEVSGAGDMGFTTGPWTWSADRDQPPAAFGQFVSVWRRAAGGPWRVALDTGISHDDPGLAIDRVEVTRGPIHEPPDTNAWKRPWVGVGVAAGSGGSGVGVGVGTGGFSAGAGTGGLGAAVGFGTAGLRSRREYEWRRTAHEKHRLMSAERHFAFVAQGKGWGTAYAQLAAKDVRHLREGRRPSIGPDSAAARCAGVPGRRTWLPRGHGVAASWDLGYAYGLVVTARRGSRPDTAGYTHLWRQDDAGAWRMMLDVENPFPRR